MFLRQSVASVGVFVVCGFVGFAVAQDGGSSLDVVKLDQLSADKTVELTPAQQQAQAQKVLSKAQQTCSRQAKMLNSARQDRDIIRATCLDDKLMQCNANLTTLQSRIASHKEATAGGDDSRRNHEFTVITVLSQKFSVLAQAANQCIGQDIFETGDTTVTTEIDPDSPTEDPTVLPELPEPKIPYIPPPVSGVT